jgi:hypothetical protein
MATTTTNFGWDIPQSTDLVKDGATAIAALGQDIDTALVDLKGGTTGQVLAKASGTDLDFSWVAQDDSNAIQNAIVDAKGDIIAATAADTPARLAVGANDTVLTADSTAATGLKWAAVSGGGMTLLNSGGTALSTGSVTVSITSTGYTSLKIYLKNVYGSNNAESTWMRINGDTGSNYSYSGIRNDGGISAVNAFSSTSIPYLVYQYPSNNTDLRKGSAMVDIFQPTGTDRFEINWQSFGFSNTSTSGNVAGSAIYDGSAAITSLTFFASAGTFAGGTVYIYGVK